MGGGGIMEHGTVKNIGSSLLVGGVPSGRDYLARDIITGRAMIKLLKNTDQ